jgi:outer membrane protein assembly factor BamB
MRDLMGGVLLAAFVCLAYLQSTSIVPPQVNDDRVKQLAAATLTDTKSQAGDWPIWRGLARDGIARDDIRADWPAGGPAKLWEKPTGEGYSSIAVADGRVFAFFQAGDDETLVAYDRHTGQEQWRFGFPAYYRNPYGNGPRSTPTVDEDRVYTVGGIGMLHCIDAKTGDKRWSKDLLKEFKAPTPQWGISFSPLVDGERLIVCPGGADGSIVALDKRTGAALWNSPIRDGGGYSSPLLAELGGQTQLVAFTAAGLVGLDRQDGTLLWRFEWTTSFDCNVTTPVVTGDYIFISSGYNRGCALVHIQKTSGGWSAERVYENKRLCSHFASCVRFGDTIFGFHESTFVAMNFRDGQILWRQRGFGKGEVVGVGGRLLILGEGGDCALAEASPQEYQEISRFNFSNERCWTVPVVAHGLLYLRDQKTLACFDVRK